MLIFAVETLNPFINVVHRFQLYSVLVTDLSHDKNHLVGHNEFYEQILLPKDMELMGKTVQVEIVAATKFSMVGKVITGSVLRPTEFEPLKAGQVSGVGVKKSSSEVQQPEERNLALQLFKWSFLFSLLAFFYRIVERFF